jgi:drug/metabolite transporter (DMT)-like permease
LPGFLERRSTAYLAMTVAATAWAGNWVVARGLHELFPPVALAFWRWLAACAVLAPFALRHVVRDRASLRRSWGRMIGFGSIGTTAFAVLGYWGLQYTTAMNAVVLNAAIPVFTTLLGTLVVRECFSTRLALALLAALGGTLLIASHGEPQRLLSAEFNRGDLILLVAVISWAAYTVGLRWRPLDMHALTFIFVSGLIGVACCLPLFLLEFYSGARPELGSRAILGVAYLCLFPSITAYLCWNFAVPRVGHNIAGVFSNITAVLGTVGSILFLGEEAHWYHLSALILACLAVYLASARPAPAPTQPGGSLPGDSMPGRRGPRATAAEEAVAKRPSSGRSL